MEPEKLYRTIVDRCPDAIVVGDREGNILLWNEGAESIFGYPAAEVVGRSMEFIIPETLRGRHGEGYRNAMARGTTKYGKELLAVPAVRKDGTRISIEFSVLMLRDETGSPSGVAAVIRDVTARWQKEKALKERLAALESLVPGKGPG